MQYTSSSEKPTSSSEKPTSSSEKPTSSSEKPTSSSERVHFYYKANNKILWALNPKWYTETNKLGYPRPQGNIPMMQTLTTKKQESLLQSYNSVYGNSVDHIGNWKPFDLNNNNSN